MVWLINRNFPVKIPSTLNSKRDNLILNVLLLKYNKCHEICASFKILLKIILTTQYVFISFIYRISFQVIIVMYMLNRKYMILIRLS